MKFNQFATFLFSTQWIISGNDQRVLGNERPLDCCATVSHTRIPVDYIVHYSIQEAPSCLIKAVRFYTKKNKIICSDPDSDWAKRMIQKLSPTLEAHKETIHSHTNSAATTTATHKTLETHTETSTRTTVQQTATTASTFVENGRPVGLNLNSTDTKTSVHHSSRLIKVFRPREKKVLRKIQMGISSTHEDGPPVSCCRLGDIRPHLDQILTYRIQTEEMCPIRAVLFQTVAGNTLCSDPESNWTKSAMWKVDEEQRKLREQEHVAVDGASVEERRGTEDPMTTAEMPLNSRATTTMMTGNERPPDCCTTVTNIRIPVDNIVAYNFQEPPLCSIKAVRFYTKKGKVICSDSNSYWAKTVIMKLSPSTEPHYY